MINKLGLTTIILSVTLLTGCGGGSSKKEKTITEQISERDAVVIIHGTNAAFCELMKVIIMKNNEVKDVIIDVPVNTVNCSTYGKNNDEDTCKNTTLADAFELTDEDNIEIFQDNSTACVMGLNKIK